VAAPIALIVLLALVTPTPESTPSEATPPTTTQETTTPTTTEEKKEPSEKAVKAHEHAQAYYTAARSCVVVFVVAAQSKTTEAGASAFLEARDLCENTRQNLASDFNTDDIDDEVLPLWAATDEAKQGSNSALNYLDTQAPSKLADFRQHVSNASHYLVQGKRELNARLRELGARPVT
jgi:hypothetical protein